MAKILPLRARGNPELEARCREAIAWAKARQNDRPVWIALNGRPELSSTMVRLLSEEGLEWADLADQVAKVYGLPGPLEHAARRA